MECVPSAKKETWMLDKNPLSLLQFPQTTFLIKIPLSQNLISKIGKMICSFLPNVMKFKGPCVPPIILTCLKSRTYVTWTRSKTVDIFHGNNLVVSWLAYSLGIPAQLPISPYGSSCTTLDQRQIFQCAAPMAQQAMPFKKLPMSFWSQLLEAGE